MRRNTIRPAIPYRHTHMHCVRLTVIVLALLLSPVPARAQPESRSGEAAAKQWHRPEEIPARADALLRRLEVAKPDALAQAAVDEIESGLDDLGTELDALLDRVNMALAQSASLAELEDVRRELMGTATPLPAWEKALAAEAKHMGRIFDEVERSREVWRETRTRPGTAAAGDVIVRRVDSSIAALDEAMTALEAWRARILAVSDRLVDRRTSVAKALEKLDAATTAVSLFIPDRPPLWQRGFGSELLEELPRLTEEIRAYNASTREYVARDARPFVVQGLMAVLLMLVLRSFSTRARQRLAGAQETSRAARLLGRPYAIGLLLALLASPVFHPLAPQRLMQVVAVLALFPAARIVIDASQRANLSAFAGLFVLLFLDRLALALAPLPALARATFMLALMIALGLTFWSTRSVRIASDAPWLRRAANLAMAGLALALVAEIGGWSDLATLLGRGVLASVLAALYVYAGVIAIEALLVYALASPALRHSRLVGRTQAIVQRRLEFGLRWLGIGAWLYLTLGALGLRSEAVDGLRALLALGISVGELSLSVGGMLAFVLTLVAALFLSRIINGVLEDEIYPRTTLPRGIPYALSTVVRYGVYSLGFLLALAAAGVELGQLAIMLGGLGVGIGLGLQDLVKNFAAGLTLLFERRVHVGDAVQISNQEIFGRVIAIGTRATVVRNWNGAEVVVPNSDMVSNAITNWTLSDRLHRIEVPVGVAYGTDPDRIIALLLSATAGNEQLLADPPPAALFIGFGDSSLNFVLRAWTDQVYENTLALTSELALAVHHALRDAEIVIPFPQRDLHLASVTPEVRDALAGGERKAS